ncbi:sensor histidine kinase [Clostridium sp. WILCCON 0269]|uniref:Sensor histidine kinase n=1 Tax=Candidatus Clostridium eludens TaxID=3381663 RepID=A0ABW8SMP5_9CLOT
MHIAIRQIVVDIIETLLLLGIFETLYDKKRFIIQNKIKTGLLFIFLVFAAYWSRLHMLLVYHTLFLVVFITLILSWITKIRIFHSAIIVSLFFTILFSTEFFTQIILMVIFNINLNQAFFDFRYVWIATLTSKILQILIVAMIFKFNSYFTKLRLFEREGAIFANLILELGVFTLFIFCINYGIFNIKNIQTYNIFIFIMYFIFLIAKFKSLQEKQLAVDISINYKIQEHQIKNMEEIISIIRQEKHDFANHINVIQGLCSLNKPNTVERIDNYVRQISDTIHSSFRYLDTGNDYIDGLLSIKNNYAVKNNIDFKVTIKESFSLLKIRQDELISIISNLVDNAFESFQLTSNIQRKEISITTFKEYENFCIEVSDNGDVIPENIVKKVFNKGFSTKTKQNDTHGFGLYITKQLVEKNNGTISVKSVPERTKFLIKFKMEGNINE